MAVRPKKGLRVVARIKPENLDREFLDELLDSKHQLIGVITSADSLPEHLQEAGVKHIKEPHELQWSQGAIKRRLKNPHFKRRFSNWLKGVRALEPDVGVVFYGGRWIPPQLAKLPKHGFLNFHPAPLPELRGPDPTVAMVLERRTSASGTVHRIADRFDQGEILGRTKDVDIRGLKDPDTISSEIEDKGIGTMIRVLDKIDNGTIQPEQQDESKATYCTKRELKRMSRIDWSQDDFDHLCAKDYASRDCRRFLPVYLTTRFQGKPLRLTSVKRANTEYEELEGEPGEIVAIEHGRPIVKTLNGAVKLDFVNAPKMQKRMQVGSKFS